MRGIGCFARLVSVAWRSFSPSSSIHSQPLSGGANGVYLALGAAYVGYDGPDPCDDAADPRCPVDAFGPYGFSGPAASGGVGVRFPFAGRAFVRADASALVRSDAVLPALRVGLGLRVR